MDGGGASAGGVDVAERSHRDGHERRRFAVTWPQVTAGTVLRLLAASAVVGMAMAYFDFTPRDVVRYVTGFATEIVDNAAAWVGTAISYVLLGAVIVVPIWLISLLLKTFRR